MADALGRGVTLPHGYRWLPWEQLGTDDLYDALALRCRAFILEQGPYLDPDGLDRRAWHLLARDPQGLLQAYLRGVEPGAKYAEPSIGRVVTAPECRGQGLGRELMRQGIAACEATWPGQGIRISAQARLEGFYRSLGFDPAGAEYLEDGIPHREMFRRSPR